MSSTRQVVVNGIGMTKVLTNKSESGGDSKKHVMFEQLVEVGPGEMEKKREERRGGMLDRSVTASNHWLLIGLVKQTGFCSSGGKHTLHFECPEGQRDVCVSDRCVTCKYHKARPHEEQKKKFNRALKQACLCCSVHTPSAVAILWSLRNTQPLL